MSAVICNITDTMQLIKYRIACHNQNGKMTTGSTGNYTGHRAGMFSCTGQYGSFEGGIVDYSWCFLYFLSLLKIFYLSVVSFICMSCFSHIRVCLFSRVGISHNFEYTHGPYLYVLRSLFSCLQSVIFQCTQFISKAWMPNNCGIFYDGMNLCTNDFDNASPNWTDAKS